MSSAASLPSKPARRSSRRRWTVIVPNTSRDAPAPTPQRIAASAAASRTRGWSARPRYLFEHSSRTGLPSSTTRGPWGPLTIRVRRYRPSSRSSARRSVTSVNPSPFRDRGAQQRSRGLLGPRVRRAVGARRRGAPALVAQLARGVPEADLDARRLGLSRRVQEGLDDIGRLALQPAAAVVRPGRGAVVGLAGDVEPELGEHCAILG